MNRRPNIIFCNMTCAGSSALDPILRDLLAGLEYDLVPVYPHNTEQLREFLGGEQPLYHWTHDPVATYAGLMPRGDFKFLYLYRDPRDVLVSLTKDHLHLGRGAGRSEKQILSATLQHELPPLLTAACDWRRLDSALCFPFTFEEMKRDIPGMVRRIFAFLGLPLDEAALAESAHRHSFETVTGRKRGEEGPTVRTGYLYRKGISGGWKQHFDAELVAQCKHHLGAYLAELGYEPDDDWGCFFPAVQFAQEPGVPEAQALAYSLRACFEVFEDQVRPELACTSDLLAVRTMERPTIVITGDRDLPAEDEESAPGYRTDSAFSGLSSAEAAVYSALFWQVMKEWMSVLIVPLAEVRSRPTEALRRMLRFLGLPCTEDIIAEWMRRMPETGDIPSPEASRPSALPNLENLRPMAAQAYWKCAGGLSSEVGSLLNQAQMQLKAGCVTHVQKALHRVLIGEILPPNDYLAALCCHAALAWVRALFTEAQAHTPAAVAAFELLRDLNACFLAQAGVQRALIRALELPDAPEEAQHFARLGEALFAAEEWTGAEKALMQGLALDPKSSLLHNDLGVLFWKLGEMQKAISHLETALRLDPSNLDALVNAKELVTAVG